ncbi:MAG: ABC transporter ATP-binding protein [Acidimicrobiales bacterium]
MASTRSVRRRRILRRSSAGEPSIWSIYRPAFRDRRGALLLMSGFSFASGLAEGVLLVMVASIAIEIGASGEGTGTLDASVGPFSAAGLSLGTSFLVTLGLGLARFAFQMASANVAGSVSAALTADIRASTFADYARASWAEQARQDEAEVQDLLVRHVNRVTASVGVVSNGIAAACTLVALLASALLVDVLAAVLLAVAGATLFVLIRPLTRIAKRVAIRGQEAGTAYSQRSMEAIGASLEMRAFGVTEQVTESLAIATAREARPTYTTFVLRQLVTSLYQMATILLLLGGLYATWRFVDQPLAQLGAIVVILIRALTQTNALQGAYHLLSETAPFMERLEAERARFRAEQPRTGDERVGEVRSLRFDHVSYRYGDDDRAALDDVSFDVRAGEAVGIIGPSGSGKSTLIQVLLRLREPVGGCFYVNDVDAGEISDDEWFSKVALVPQDHRMLNGTIRENIAFYREASEDDVIAAAKRAHVHDEILAMPHGYDTPLGSRGGALSGGQRQRVSIARALLRRPPVLVLDEPTSALDMRSESLVHTTFSELKGEVTIFVIAHRLSTLNTCDRIMVMQRGRLQAFGDREELERDNEFYRDAIRLSQIRN